MSAGPRVRGAALTALGLLVAVAAVHGRSLFAGFVYDDRWTLLDNPVIRDSGNLWRLVGPDYARAGVPDAGRPLLLASEMLDWALYGAWAQGFHLQNLLWHAGVVLLVWRLFARLGLAPAVAGLGAAIFAVHPLLVEPVAAINYREDLLATFFTLAALSVGLGRARGRALAAGALLLLGLFAKESALVAPLLFAILVVTGAAETASESAAVTATATRGTVLARLRGEAGTLGVLVLVALVVTGWRAWAFGALGVVSLTAEIPEAQRSLAFALPRGALAFGFGVGQWLWPAWPLRLAPEYPDLAAGALTSALGWAAWVLLAGLSVLAWRRCVFATKGASPPSPVATRSTAYDQPVPRPAGLEPAGTETLRDEMSPGRAAGLGWLLALAAYLPHLGFVPLTNQRADRYFYLPAVGLALATTAALAALRGARPLLPLALLPALLGLRAVGQGRVWRDDVSVFRAAVAAAPGSQRAQLGLGTALLRQRRTVEALAAAEAALALGQAPSAWQLRGLVRLSQGDHPGARTDLERALAGSAGAGRAQVLHNLALARERGGDRTGARLALAEAVKRAPRFEPAALALARLHTQAGDLHAAEATLDRLLSAVPESAEAWRQKAALAARAGRGTEAVAAQARAARLERAGR